MSPMGAFSARGLAMRLRALGLALALDLGLLDLGLFFLGLGLLGTLRSGAGLVAERIGLEALLECLEQVDDLRRWLLGRGLNLHALGLLLGYLPHPVAGFVAELR